MEKKSTPMRGCDSWYDNDYSDIKGRPRVSDFEKDIWPHIEDCFSKDKTVLDVGCGNGRFSNFFKTYVKNVSAIDPWQHLNPLFVADNLHYQQIGLMDFDIPDWMGAQKYDIIFMNGVFYLFNFKDETGSSKALKKGGQAAAIHKTKAILTEGGILILMGGLDRLVESAHEIPGRYDIPKICSKYNFEIVDIFKYPQYNYHMTVLRNLGDKE